MLCLDIRLIFVQNYRIFYQLYCPKTILLIFCSNRQQRYNQIGLKVQMFFKLTIGLAFDGIVWDSLAEQFKSRVLEAWRACYHKKIVAGSAATAFWNMSSLKTRIFAGESSILCYHKILGGSKCLSLFNVNNLHLAGMFCPM